jgi:hypothetical protein
MRAFVGLDISSTAKNGQQEKEAEQSPGAPPDPTISKHVSLSFLSLFLR